MYCRSDDHLPGGTFQSSLSTLRFSDFICTQGIMATPRLFRTKETNPRSPPESIAQGVVTLQIPPVGKPPRLAHCPVPGTGDNWSKKSNSNMLFTFFLQRCPKGTENKAGNQSDLVNQISLKNQLMTFARK